MGTYATAASQTEEDVLPAIHRQAEHRECAGVRVRDRGNDECESFAGLDEWTSEVPFADEQLLEVVAVDPSALEPLYDRYAKLVYGVARTILDSREEAEDLTHELFVTLCEPTGYDPERGSVGAFFATMTRSRAIDRLRRRGRSVRLLKAWYEGAAPAPGSTTPFEHVALRHAAERVRALLAELPLAQRQVLELAYYRGLSQWEIAAHLDMPLGTVKSRLRRALIKLERALETARG